QAEIAQSNPFLRNSFLIALLIALGGRIFEVYEELESLLLELFPDTASDDFLARWGSYLNIVQNDATQATGKIIATGVIGSTITTSANYQSQNGSQYDVQQNVTIAENVNTIPSLTFNSGTVTAITSGEHNYASNMQVIISGADQAEYNGTFTIFVTGDIS